jgi:hypothetical protein
MPKYSGFTARQDRPGFWITFANGWRVSVQFGKRNYCSNRDESLGLSDGEPTWDSPDAEIALIDPTGAMRELAGESDTVRGYVTPDQLLAFMATAAVDPMTLVEPA